MLNGENSNFDNEPVINTAEKFALFRIETTENLIKNDVDKNKDLFLDLTARLRGLVTNSDCFHIKNTFEDDQLRFLSKTNSPELAHLVKIYLGKKPNLECPIGSDEKSLDTQHYIEWSMIKPCLANECYDRNTWPDSKKPFEQTRLK